MISQIKLFKRGGIQIHFEQKIKKDRFFSSPTYPFYSGFFVELMFKLEQCILK